VNRALTKSWLKVVLFAIVSVTSCFVSITPEEGDDVIAVIVLPRSERAARECHEQMASAKPEGLTSSSCSFSQTKIEIGSSYFTRYTPIALTAFPIRP
jgi:hypothetical protein